MRRISLFHAAIRSFTELVLSVTTIFFAALRMTKRRVQDDHSNCRVRLSISYNRNKPIQEAVLKTYLILILCMYLLKEGFEFILQYLNLRHMKKYGFTVPPEFEGYIDEDLLKKTIAYETEKTRFSFISSLFSNIITIVFIFGGLLNIYNSWVASLHWPFILTGVLFFFLLSYASTILSIPFSLYSTFKIENKYGFNTMTPKLWIIDFEHATYNHPRKTDEFVEKFLAGHNGWNPEFK